jgi:hypothetical protein
MCPRCKRGSEFFIAEAKFKVDIFYIPTFTLKSRYAVICDKCKQGEFCSDQWAVKLINRTETLSIIFESQEKMVDTAVQNDVSTSSQYVTDEQNNQRSISDINEDSPCFFKCQYCGITQLYEGAFCTYCGKPAPKDPVSEHSILYKSPLTERICPSCGTKIDANATFCIECGTKL